MSIITRNEFEKLLYGPKDEDLPTKILRYLKKDSEHAYDLQQLSEYFKKDREILQDALNELLKNKKIETDHDKNYYIYKKTPVDLVEVN